MISMWVVNFMQQNVRPNSTLHISVTKDDIRISSREFSLCVSQAEIQRLRSVFETMGINTYPNYSAEATTRLLDYCCMERWSRGALSRCIRCGDQVASRGTLCQDCANHMHDMKTTVTLRAASLRREGVLAIPLRDVHGEIACLLYQLLWQSNTPWQECQKYFWW